MRRCLTCGTLTPATRCPAHTAAQRAIYDHEWRKTSLEARAMQPWCSWCGATEDLTTDHVVPGDPSVVMVLCRGCNTRKASGLGPPVSKNSRAESSATT